MSVDELTDDRLMAEMVDHFRVGVEEAARLEPDLPLAFLAGRACLSLSLGRLSVTIREPDIHAALRLPS